MEGRRRRDEGRGALLAPSTVSIPPGPPLILRPSLLATRLRKLRDLRRREDDRPGRAVHPEHAHRVGTVTGVVQLPLEAAGEAVRQELRPGRGLLDGGN